MSDVEVSFSIENSPDFDQPSNESGHGLTVEFASGRLAKVSVSVSSVSDRQAAIVAAKQELNPLLAFIQFGTGTLPRLGRSSTSLDGGPYSARVEVSMEVEVTRRRVPFPPLSLFTNLTGGRVRQIGWYSAGMKSEWVIERIRNFYEVLELEEELTKRKYKPPDNLRFLRNAASHSHLDDPKAVTWLCNKIGKNYIDPLNLEDLNFLNSETPALESVHVSRRFARVSGVFGSTGKHDSRCDEDHPRIRQHHNKH